MSFDVVSVTILAVVGLVGGMAGGMLGIGGSVIFIPAMDQVLGEPGRNLYLVWASAALICNVFVGAGGAIGHWRNRRVIPQVVKKIIPMGTVAAVVGVWAAGELDERVLWIIFGTVVCYMVYRNVQKLFHKSEPAALSSGDALDSIDITWPRISAVAAPTGFLAGMLGIGGGIYSVPGQQIFMRMPQKNAIANSSATMIVFCTIAAIVRNMAPLPEGVARTDPLIIAAILIPPALVGAFLGGHLTHRLPDRLVRAVFVGFLLWTVYKCFVQKAHVAALVRDWIG